LEEAVLRPIRKATETSINLAQKSDEQFIAPNEAIEMAGRTGAIRVWRRNKLDSPIQIETQLGKGEL